MKVLAPQTVTRQFQGYVVYALANDEIELAVVPDLGAKIISLKNRRTGREWFWFPNADLKLFKNRPGDDFSTSPLVGMDECLPTISPCDWRGRKLPDHGEVWHQPWQMDESAWRTGVLTTSIRLPISPFLFQRTIELQGNQVQLSYQLTNLGDCEEPFVWAAHPLLRLAAGDQLHLPDSTRTLLPKAAWLNAVTTAVPALNCAKIFANPVSEGRAAICNEQQGDGLEFTWPAAENSVLGLWLTRGGWHGHHHFAMEPTNANDDSLALAVRNRRCGRVAAGSSLRWQLTVRVGL